MPSKQVEIPFIHQYSGMNGRVTPYSVFILASTHVKTDAGKKSCVHENNSPAIEGALCALHNAGLIEIISRFGARWTCNITKVGVTHIERCTVLA